MKRSSAAEMGRWTMSAGALVVLATAASAQSRPLSIVTNENPARPGAFTLDFGGLGVVARSNITSTTYELSVDTVNGTARFVSYLQHVEPLTLPGGLSTGNITVEIVPGSSSGTYDPFTKTFTTSEMYAVHFDGDLSAFGLTSPVLLPSSSEGLVVVGAVVGGEVTMDWDGIGQLSNPFDPANPLTFTYQCAVDTLFPATPANMVGLTLMPDVASLHLPQGIAVNMIGLLEQSLARIQRGKLTDAAQNLREFINKVNGLNRLLIGATDAANLVARAQETIDLMGLGRPVLPSGPHRAK